MTAPGSDSAAAPTVEEVRRVTAIANPVIRNLEVTYCYARLSAAMVRRTGPCANWCTYATWASRQAGRTIRGEDLVETLRARLRLDAGLLHPLTALGRRLLRHGLFDPASALGRLTAQLHTPFDAFEMTSDAVARGNRKAFEEIGMHEQTRLQPEIRESLDSPYAMALDLDARLMRALMPWWRWPPPRVLARPVEALGARTQRAISDLAREIISKALMVMSLPGRVLALGANMDEPFPALLAELHDADLTALLARFEPAAGVLDVTAARDWSVFEQRMHYIAHLFRAFHLHEELLGAPFTAAQVRALRAGTVPDGDL